MNTQEKGALNKMNEVSEKIKTMKDGTVITPAGFYAAGLHSGVKRSRKDLGVLYCENPASAAAVYTMNQIKAAPLYVTKESIAEEGKLQAVIINSGNANACTGEKGMQDAYEMRKVTAEKFQLKDHLVAVASTGIIGVEMPMEKIVSHIEKLDIGQQEEDAANLAESILTTDTFTKSVCCQTEINGKVITMGGVAKGSGMIEPNMGTMLSFLTTDAVIEPDMLQLALKQTVDKTYNCITVDGDTSTNDMVIALASEQADNETLTPAHPEWDQFLELMLKTNEALVLPSPVMEKELQS